MDIDQMAADAGFTVLEPSDGMHIRMGEWNVTREVQLFAELVLEEAARVCEALTVEPRFSETADRIWPRDATPQECAAAIRALIDK